MQQQRAAAQMASESAWAAKVEWAAKAAKEARAELLQRSVTADKAALVSADLVDMWLVLETPLIRI